MDRWMDVLTLESTFIVILQSGGWIAKI